MCAEVAVHSQIILVVLAPGEAYIVDLRKQHRGREELCEIQDENESDEEGQSRSRYVQVVDPSISVLT